MAGVTKIVTEISHPAARPLKRDDFKDLMNRYPKVWSPWSLPFTPDSTPLRWSTPLFSQLMYHYPNVWVDPYLCLCVLTLVHSTVPSALNPSRRRVIPSRCSRVSN